jgi:signal transduction histidine kinase
MENKIKLGLALTVLVLLVNAVVSYHAIRTLVNNEQWVGRTHVVLAQLEAILSTVKDAETGERGYIISGSEAYLAPYHQALSQIAGDVQNLRNLTMDNPTQSARVPVLERKIADRLEILKRGVELRRSGDMEGVNTMIATGAGRRMMDDLRFFIDGMEAAENQLLAERTRESQRSQRNTIVTFVVANLISCGILIATATMALNGIRARRQAEEERSRLLAEAQRARQTAEAASRAKDQFLAILSHELRTPLTSVYGWVQMMKRNNLDNATETKALEVIDRNIRLQTQLIDDLLNVSQIASGKLQIHHEKTDPRQVIQSAIEAAKPAADSKDIFLRFDSDPDLPLISADPARFQQIVWNLISNAVKFTPKGGEILVWAGAAGNDLQIVVRDSGQGISADFLPQVFERFTQADASSTRRHGGLGLGLALVKQLVELHGGTVEAESAGVGKGSKFTVHLPIAA